MIAVDYIILNRDRHGANIEVLRNSRAHSLRIAPLFDHGLSLMYSCIVGTGGYSITFDNSIDIASHLLYKKGLELPLSVNDFISFAKRGLVDTSEACEILECSRQNLSYMINNDQINCIKKNVRGNLFLKGEILLSRQ